MTPETHPVGDGRPMDFVHQSWRTRVLFGAGRRAQIAAEVQALGLSRVLVISTPGRASLGDAIAADLGPAAVAVLPAAQMHVPVESVDVALALAASAGVDGYVAVGGGSATGLAKAMALRVGQPYVALPSTYAGSEMTPIWGISEHGEKRTGRDERVLPRVVVYDPELTYTLPLPVSAASGLNAIAHAVEALYAPDRSPLVSLLAAEGVRAITQALPAIAVHPADLAARSQALYGSWLCGICLGATTMGLHHRLCHILGGTFDLPHAQTHAVVLPYVLAFNDEAAPEAVDALATALGEDEPAAALQSLGQSLAGVSSLQALGLRRPDVDAVVELAVQNPYANPGVVSAEALHRLLLAAWQGAPVDRRPGRPRTPASA